MALSQPRPGPATNASNLRSIITSRVDKKSFSQPFQPSQPSQPHMPAGLSIIEQFRIHRDSHDASFPHLENEDENGDEDEDENNAVRRRISYTREQKLGAISYATNTWKIRKNESSQLISKRAAANHLGITRSMLRKWIANKSEIENTTKGTRKNRSNNIACQESEMENRLTELFIEARNSGRKVTNRWFARHARNIYGQLHPNRVIKRPGKLTEYIDFKFSNGWFRGYKKRHRIGVRVPTKKSQEVSYLFY